MSRRDEPLCDPNELARKLRAGDIQAVDRLTRCYGERLLAAARRHCRDEHDARDAFQDAVLNAWTHRESFRGEGRLDGWMLRLVASACSRMRRGRKNDPKLHSVGRELPAQAPSPERGAYRAEIATALGNALVELAPRDRLLVLLADGEGWKGPEIARELGLSAGSVRTRLSRARARLRAQLERSLQLEGD